jgi:hypothetical protein
VAGAGIDDGARNRDSVNCEGMRLSRGIRDPGIPTLTAVAVSPQRSTAFMSPEPLNLFDIPQSERINRMLSSIAISYKRLLNRNCIVVCTGQQRTHMLPRRNAGVRYPRRLVGPPASRTGRRV